MQTRVRAISVFRDRPMSNYIDKLFDRTMPLLQRTLDLSLKRGEAIVSNVSNAETPGYRAVDVNFAGELERAAGQLASPLKTTNVKHIDTQSSSGQAHLVADLSGQTRPDGNNVDIDIQMGKLAQNSGQYVDAANMMRKKLQMLRNAIRFAQQ